LQEAIWKGSLKLRDIPSYPALLGAVKKMCNDVFHGGYRIKDLALVTTHVFTGCRIDEVVQPTRRGLDVKRRTVMIKQLKKRVNSSE